MTLLDRGESMNKISRDVNGRNKSCRRSSSELFAKEDDQPPHLPEMTPLRWRSTSLKDLQASEASNSLQPTSESSLSPGSKPPKPTGELSNAQGVDSPQAAGSSSHSQAGSGQTSEHASPIRSPQQLGDLPTDSIRPVEEPGPTQPATAVLSEPVNNVSSASVSSSPQNSEPVRSRSATKKIAKSLSQYIKPLPKEDSADVIEFKPVDLDQKYRQKELIRHITAAKIQNREESILSNPDPALETRKLPTGDEPAAMTIEFLRARLLAERSASKATKQQMTQLSKKVSDLETRLAAEIELRKAEVELRKKAEIALQDALSKLNQAGLGSDQGLKESVPSVTGTQKVEDKEPKSNEEIAAEVKVEASTVSNFKTVVRTDSLPRQVVNGEAAVDEVSGDNNETSSSKTSVDYVVTAQAAGLDCSQQNTGSENGTRVTETSDSGSSPDRDVSSSQHRKDIRAGIEERLRSMWRQIGQEMAALAEVKGDEDTVRQDLLGWMGQVPSVLQDKSSVERGSIQSDTKYSGENKESEVHMERSGKKDGVLSNLPASANKRDGFDKNASLAKNVADIVSEFEAQETAQREWEENFEARQSIEQEDEMPPLVTSDGEVIKESGSNGGVSRSRAGVAPPNQVERQMNEPLVPLPKSKSLVSSPQPEASPSGIKSFPSSSRAGLLRSRSQSFDLSPQPELARSKSQHFESTPQPALSRSKSDLSSPVEPISGKSSRRASFNGRIEIINGSTDSGVEEELLYDPEDTGVAEELPNGIYIHHSREEVDSYRRAASTKDLKYGRTPERMGVSNGYASPGTRPDRGSHGRERYPSFGGPVEMMSEMDSQGWPMREANDRASRDVYYAPVINNRSNARGDPGPYNNSERDYLHRTRTERGVPDETLYRNGPGSRWDPQMPDPSWVPRQEERRVSDSHYSLSSSDDGRNPYPYPERDHPDHEVQYRNAHRQRGDGVHRGDGYRGGPPPWQEGPIPGFRGRSKSHNSYGYPPTYSMEEPRMPTQNMDAGGYNNNRPEMFYPPYGAANSRPEYYSQNLIPGSRPAVNGFSHPDPPSTTRGYSSWDGSLPQEERSAAVVPADDGPGDAGEVLKALRIAKQQIKSSTGEQASFMTAQYTVSSEHRYGVGGQVSKTSYTVEAPVGYPRVTKTVHEGWHLEGKPKVRGGYGPGLEIDVSGARVTDLITAGPITVAGGESSYVEKLNVGRGIQFFFS